MIEPKLTKPEKQIDTTPSTDFRPITSLDSCSCFWCGKKVTRSELKSCSEGYYCSKECIRKALLYKKKLLDEEIYRFMGMIK